MTTRYNPSERQHDMLDTESLLFSNVFGKYGPTAFLGRTMLTIETELRLRGVRLAFEPLDALLDINRRDAEDWRPLISIFDATFHDFDESNAFCLIGRDAQGRVVTTQAARLLDWEDTSFRREAENLRLFYKEPEQWKRPGERCTVSALAAETIRGRVVFSGAAWNAPAMRGKGLVKLLPRLARAYAHSRWNSDVTVTMMAEDVVKRGVFPRNGYRNIEWGVSVWNSRMGDVEFSLQWMKTAEMLADLRSVAEDLTRREHSRSIV